MRGATRRASGHTARPAAAIWGSAFVAQRLSLDVIGPFLFTG
ncbi:EamA/RhaT family transporter, partial [Burkholderia multivorans]|nr:EamA/RhaT family transporter [Burkholderia multivorans]